MELAEAKLTLEGIEDALDSATIVLFATFEARERTLQLFLTERFKRLCRKGKVWGAPGMLSSLKNAAYGFDPDSPRSRGGSDGIFKLDRHFRPPNSMMKKLFDRFLDKPDPLVDAIERELGSKRTDWLPVRLVSHHMRLLGVLDRSGKADRLVLVDFDDDKH